MPSQSAVEGVARRGTARAVCWILSEGQKVPAPPLYCALSILSSPPMIVVCTLLLYFYYYCVSLSLCILQHNSVQFNSRSRSNRTRTAITPHLISSHLNCSLLFYSTLRSLLCQAFKTVPAKSRFHVFLECSRVEVCLATLNQHHHSDFLLHI